MESWSWRAEVILPVAILGVAYTAGWLRLRMRNPRLAGNGQFGGYLAGLAILCLALLSPIDGLASRLFTMHMLQHLLLGMVAPPLLLLANPLPAVLWGLPRRLRHGVDRLLTREALVRRSLRAMTLMPVAWGLYTLTLWGWHLPAAYEAALNHEGLHDLQHLSIFGAALLFWWPIINPAPYLRGHVHPGLQVVYLVLAAFQKAGLGLLLALSPRVLYPSYAVAPRVWGWSPLEDQAWGGILMWGLGGVIDMLAVLVLLFKFFSLEERVPLPRGVSEPDVSR